MESHSREIRTRAESAIEQMQGTTDKRRETMQQLLQRWETVDSKLSNQLLATSSPDYLRAFAKLARSSGRTEVLSDRERHAVARAMSLADSSGGYLVPFQLDPTVILTSDGSLNEIRQIARQVVATGDVWHGVSAGNVSWSFDPVHGQAPANNSSGAGTGAVSEVSDDSPEFAQPEVTVKTARGFVPISLEAFMDESNVAAEVGRLLADGKDELESQVFITGTGFLEPAGLITRLAASATAETLSAASNAFALEDVYTLHDALPARYRRRAAWLGNQSIYSLTRQFDESGGSALWAQLGAARPQVLLGRPAYEAEPMDGVVDSGSDNYVLIFGDFQYYVIADRIGMTVEFVPHLFGATGVGSPAVAHPTGQRGWFAYYRVGADVTHAGGFRLLNIGANTT
jgi:HK97 family phage major capsid protein